MNNKVVLASSSPRRSEFLKNMGIPFEVIVPSVDESPLENESPVELVKRLAYIKAKAISDKVKDRVILAADTIVVIDDDILGKPKDREDAFLMIKKLQDRTHQVYSAVCVAFNDEFNVELEKTNVTFSKIPDALIRKYVATGECDDKSGSYAVQGIATMFVEKVEGSVSSVVGLPCVKTRLMLQKYGIEPLTL